MSVEFDQVMSILKVLGDPHTKRMLMRLHGVKEPCWG
jgi:hypothetical protein